MDQKLEDWKDFEDFIDEILFYRVKHPKNLKSYQKDYKNPKF